MVTLVMWEVGIVRGCCHPVSFYQVVLVVAGNGLCYVMGISMHREGCTNRTSMEIKGFLSECVAVKKGRTTSDMDDNIQGSAFPSSSCQQPNHILAVLGIVRLF